MNRKKMKNACVILSVVLLLSAILCGCDKTEEPIGINSLIENFAAYGCELTLDADSTDDVRASFGSLRGIGGAMVYTGSGEEEVSGRNVDVYTQVCYVTCTDRDAAINAYEVLADTLMLGKGEMVYERKNAEKIVFNGVDEYKTLARNREFVVYFSVKVDSDQQMSVFEWSDILLVDIMDLGGF